MESIPQEYLVLFNAITAADKELTRLREQLREAHQQLAEEFYMSRGEEPTEEPT